MKKKFLVLTLILLILAAAGTAYATRTIGIILNNQYLMTDVPPVIIDGRVLVPLRVIGEALGVDITWDSEKNAVIISDHTISDPLTKEQLLKMAKPAVVEVTAITSSREDATGITVEYLSGTGFNIDPSGLVVTNSHVVNPAKEISVRFPNGIESDARLIAEDKGKDLALLKLTGKTRTYPVLKLGDSDNVRLGDKVVIIGNPLGDAAKVTEGTVADLSVKVRNVDISLMEINAELHPGNSGSPVLDEQGNVIGIISVKIEKRNSRSQVQMGGAIPINYLKELLPDNF